MSHSYDDSKHQALKTLSLYTYRSTGVEQNVKEFEHKQIPQEFKKYAGLTFAVGNVVINKSIVLNWTF